MQGFRRIRLGSISFFMVLLFLFSLSFLIKDAVSQEAKKVVFCSINQSSHRLYRVSYAVLRSAFDHLDIQFEMRERPPKRIVTELNQGSIDGDSHRIYDFNHDRKYRNLIRVEEWIQEVEQSVFTKSDEIKVDGWQSLLPYKVLYIDGIKVIENELEKAQFPKDNRIGVYDIDTAFNLLSLGRGDLVIVSPSTGKAALKKLGLTHSGIKLLQPALMTIKLYPYMNRKHSELAKKLAAQLKKMKSSGEYDKIVNAIF
jgi:polar amino acid transport system substrate-binding protein